MMEYIYLVIIVGIGLWSLVNKLDDHAEMKQNQRGRKKWLVYTN
ncbi:Uncharacterised protein [Streptococcus pneumoniae]|nr:Uncharacterised protein [Streptococcus pneumoniae]